jgi:hypothetical protein
LATVRIDRPLKNTANLGAEEIAGFGFYAVSSVPSVPNVSCTVAMDRGSSDAGIAFVETWAETIVLVSSKSGTVRLKI